VEARNIHTLKTLAHLYEAQYHGKFLCRLPYLREAVASRLLKLHHALVDIFVQDCEFKYPKREG
jgi:hypothetical protein